MDIQVKVWPPLPWFLTFRLSWGASQTLYWANPLERWWRNASLWGVKVGVQNVAWWAVCHRRRLPLWRGVAVGAWMTLGAGHGLCILSEFCYQSQAFGTLVLVCRLLNATNKHTNMSMSGQNSKVNLMLTLYHPEQYGIPWCRPRHPAINQTQEDISQIPCGWRTWPQ